jgi:glyoxylase-like metal-dependent hydrolase (beta-lactamase superfamily II)
MRITSLIGNSQSLDGGAMFGNVPRTVWEKWCPPDERGRIELATRAFLVEDEGRTILVETGVGAFFEPRLRERYGVIEETHILLRSLAARGLTPEDIDVVLLSHLHFDHAGGLASPYKEGEPLRLVFPRAEFIISEEAFSRARSPHPRDRASFIPEIVDLLERSGRVLTIRSGEEQHPALGSECRLTMSQGHTPGMMIPTFCGSARSATFCADLVPGSPWVHLPVTMGYDRFPERLIDEKRALYESLEGDSWLLFTHDRESAAGRLSRDDRGRYFLEETRGELSNFDLQL